MEYTSSDDPGDDVQRRFRYQNTYAAMLSLGLLDESSEIECIYCELHEDVLIQKTNGKFVGYQIKTKEYGRNPAKAKDKEVINSLKKFLIHEIDFPEKFEYYVFVHSSGIDEFCNDGNNLFFILGEAKKYQGALTDVDKRLIDYAERILENKIGDYDSEDDYQKDIILVLKMLKKLRVDNKPPPLDDIHSRLYVQVSKLPASLPRSPPEVSSMVDSLVKISYDASSLANNHDIPTWRMIIDDPKSIEHETVINGKRIDRGKLDACLTNSVLIASKGIANRYHANSSKIIAVKMEKGGIPPNDIELMTNLAQSADSYLIKSYYKSTNPVEIKKSHDDLILAVWNICMEVYGDYDGKDLQFGYSMLKEIRKRLSVRADLFEIFDCRHEHLLGIASILTGNCKVFWSARFILPEELRT